MEMIKRRKILPILEKCRDLAEAVVLTGFRRVGKTTVMRHIFDELPTQNKIYLDLESPVNQRIFTNPNYDDIKVSLEGLGLNLRDRAYVFLDEIQNVVSLPSIVKYLYDHWQVKFYLTGSSSFYLKNHFSESMSGRKFVFELYPLDFEEFLWFKDSRLTPKADYDSLISLYKEYLQYGGFPAVVLSKNNEEKTLRLDDVLGSYFQLDVEKLSNFRDNQKLKDLLFLLSARTGSKPEISKLAESLSVSRQTINEYLNFFEQTYLLHFLRPLSTSSDVIIRTVPKLYFGDTGILNRLGQVSAGQVFENKVFNQLHTKLAYQDTNNKLVDGLSYFQTRTGVEIDFVYQRRVGYEVKVRAGSYDVAKAKKIAAKADLDQVKVISLEKPSIVSADDIVFPFEF